MIDEIAKVLYEWDSGDGYVDQLGFHEELPRLQEHYREGARRVLAALAAGKHGTND